MKLEAWPGGKWYRNLGDNNGHYWGTVQAIKKPTLLEICGPLFMSNPVITNLQYQLKESGGVTLITFRHQSLGSILEEYRNAKNGWNYIHEKVRQRAETRGHIEAEAIGRLGGGKYVPSMHRKRSSNGRRSGVDGGNTGGVHREVREIF